MKCGLGRRCARSRGRTLLTHLVLPGELDALSTRLRPATARSGDVTPPPGMLSRLNRRGPPQPGNGRRPEVRVEHEPFDASPVVGGGGIHILRVAVAESDRPVMLYSMGKDSSVMLHLARKAFYPSDAPVSPAPRGHDVEVQGDVRIPGPLRTGPGAWSSSSTRTPNAWRKGSTRSPTVPPSTPISGRPRA